MANDEIAGSRKQRRSSTAGNHKTKWKNVGPALPWLIWGFAIILAVLGLWTWNIYAERVQLDNENHRELAHAAGSLEQILSSLTTTADRFFKERAPTEEVAKDRVLEFVRRNPYLQAVSDTQRSDLCGDNASLLDGTKLVLPSSVVIAGNNRVLVDVNSRAMFEDIVISSAFEYLFIVGGTGNVIFEMEHGAAAARQQQQSWLGRRAQGSAAPDPPITRIGKIDGLEGADGKKIQLEMLTASSGSRLVRLGREQYELHYYPVQVLQVREKPPCMAVATTYIVAGLIDPDQVWRAAVTISPVWTFVLFVLLVAAVAGEPFLKLLLLDKKERFRLSDACVLLPSATFLLMLATLVTLDVATYRQFRSLAEGGLERLAEGVESDFSAELSKMRAQLAEYDQKVAKIGCNVKDEPDIANLFGNAGSSAWLGDHSKYSDFTQVAWIDSSGGQFFKATIQPVNTPRQTLTNRSYFKEAKSGRLWSFEGNKVFIESIRSITDGELYTVLAMRSEMTGCDPVVTAMSSKPIVVEWPLLPIGYDFAIVESTGRVLYHSDRPRALKENIYEEMTDPERLYAAVRAGTPQHFMTHYSGRPTEIFVKPFGAIKDAEWFVLAFRDHSWLATLNTEVLLRALIWLLVPLAVPLALCFGFLHGGKRSLAYWWPNPEKSGFYRSVALAHSCALVLGVTAALFLEDGWLFAWSLGFPILTVFLTVVLYRAHAPETGQKDGRLSYRFWHLAALASIWVCTAVVPSVGLFRHSWQQEMRQLELLERSRQTQHVKDWVARDREHHEPLTIADRETFLNERRKHVDSYDHAPPYQLAFDRFPAEPAADTWLKRYLPLYNDVAVLLRYWNESPKQETEPPRRFRLASFRMPGLAFGWPTLFGIVITAAGVCWWLRQKSRNLFWSELAGKCTGNSPAEIVKTSRFVMFLTASPRESRMIASSLQQHVVRVAAADGTTVDTTTTGTLVIDDFDGSSIEQASRESILKGLEKAIKEESGRAVMVTSRDPYRLFEMPNGSDRRDAIFQISSSEKERWYRVLEPFVVHLTPGMPAAPVTNKAGAVEEELGEGYFRSVWLHCSQDERLTLVQVAEEGLANPHHGDCVKQLLQKGLLKLDPNLKLMSPTFESFVQRMGRSPQMISAERSERTLGWRRIRWILLAGFAVAVLFLVGTQQSWIKSAAGIVTGIAGALEGLRELSRSVQHWTKVGGS